MSPTERQQRIDQFFAAHRENGLPVTMQRRAVFEALLDCRDHPTAEQVYQTVRSDLPQISRMTIHRILGTFVSLDLLAKTCHPGSSARFEPNLRRHHHLVCLDCGRIIDLEDARLNKIPWPDAARHGFKIADYHIHFRGRCARCRQKPYALGAGRKAATRPHSSQNKPGWELKGTRI
jgi:Fur family transcriptional regulator, peroxide stress response regulator